VARRPSAPLELIGDSGERSQEMACSDKSSLALLTGIPQGIRMRSRSCAAVDDTHGPAQHRGQAGREDLPVLEAGGARADGDRPTAARRGAPRGPGALHGCGPGAPRPPAGGAPRRGPSRIVSGRPPRRCPSAGGRRPGAPRAPSGTAMPGWGWGSGWGWGRYGRRRSTSPGPPSRGPRGRP